MAINNTVMSNTLTDLFVSTGNSAITVIYLCNTSGSAITASIHAVPSGDTAVTNNMIYKDINIPTGDTFIVDTERLVLETGDKIIGQASVASGLSVIVSSMGI